MLFTALPSLILAFVTPWIDSIPVISIASFPAEYWNGFLSFISLVGYLIPIYAFSPLFAIILGIISFRLGMAVIKLILGFISNFI